MAHKHEDAPGLLEARTRETVRDFLIGRIGWKRVGG